jgi:hypothetical protein
MKAIKSNILTLYGYLAEICTGYNKIQLEEGGRYNRFRFAYDPKIMWLRAFLQGNPGIPLVIWTKYVEQGNMICEMLDEIGESYVNMATAPRGSWQRFDDGSVRVIVANPTQCYGWTLNRCQAVDEGIGAYPSMVYVGISWEMGAFEQSQTRCNGVDKRTGKSIATPIYVLTIKNSIEDKIVSALKNKKDVNTELLKDAERKDFSSFVEDLQLNPDDITEDMFDAEEMAARIELKISPDRRCTLKLLQRKAEEINTTIEIIEKQLDNVSPEKLSTENYHRWWHARSILILRGKFDDKGYPRKSSAAA